MKNQRIVFAAAAAALLLSLGTGGVSAAGERAIVSPALTILAGETEMIKSGLCGEELRFTAEDFEQALGVRELDSVVILTLPSEVSGKLMLGSLEVMRNQTISRINLSALRFLPRDGEEGSCSFLFRAGNAQKYDVTCTIRLLKDRNFAPTATGIGEEEFRIRTYRNIAVFGQLPAADPEEDALRYEIVDGPKRGLLTMTDRAGGFVYTPTKNYSGRDSFSYIVTDEYGNRSGIMEMEVSVERSDSGTVFTDLIGKRCHNSAIRLSELGVMPGMKLGDDLCFDPEGSVTRSEFLTMAMKLAGVDVSGIRPEAISAFADDRDIPKAHRAYVIAACSKGYIEVGNGAEAAVFRPEEEITVAEACLMVYQILDGRQSAAVGTEIGPEEAVAALGAAGILVLPEGGVSAETILTRADAAEMLTAALL